MSAKHGLASPCLVILIEIRIFLKLIQMGYLITQNDQKHTTKQWESEKTIHGGGIFRGQSGMSNGKQERKWSEHFGVG